MLVKKNLETKRRQGIVPVSFWLLLAAFGCFWLPGFGTEA